MNIYERYWILATVSALAVLAPVGCSESTDDDKAPPLPPTLGAPAAVVDALNESFDDAAPPYASLETAGVVLHSWDGTGYDDKPWIPEDGKQAHSGQSVSSSIINNKVRKYNGEGNTAKISIYDDDSGGVIYDVSTITTWCLYTGDGGTDGRSNRGCGCMNRDVESGGACEGFDPKTNSCADWKQCGEVCVNCDNICSGSVTKPCAFVGDDRVHRMVTACTDLCAIWISNKMAVPCYNEVLVNAVGWKEDPAKFFPQVVSAFYLTGDSKQPTIDKTVTAWKNSRADYASSGHPLPPLVKINLEAAKSPFELTCATPDDCQY